MLPLRLPTRKNTTKLANTQASPGNRLTGISQALSSLDSDDDSTPDMATLTYFDAPATTCRLGFNTSVTPRLHTQSLGLGGCRGCMY